MAVFDGRLSGSESIEKDRYWRREILEKLRISSPVRNMNVKYSS
jgi:hypothetical protein